MTACQSAAVDGAPGFHVTGFDVMTSSLKIEGLPSVYEIRIGPPLYTGPLNVSPLAYHTLPPTLLVSLIVNMLNAENGCFSIRASTLRVEPPALPVEWMM